MQTSEVLNRAADAIEGRGWTQGPTGWPDADRPTASVCLEGGIMAALGEHWGDVNYPNLQECPAYRAVAAYLNVAGSFPDRLCDWNDHYGRTAEEVVEVLRAAALVEETKEADAIIAAANAVEVRTVSA